MPNLKEKFKIIYATNPKALEYKLNQFRGTLGGNGKIIESTYFNHNGMHCVLIRYETLIE